MELKLKLVSYKHEGKGNMKTCLINNITLCSNIYLFGLDLGIKKFHTLVCLNKEGFFVLVFCPGIIFNLKCFGLICFAFMVLLQFHHLFCCKKTWIKGLLSFLTQLFLFEVGMQCSLMFLHSCSSICWCVCLDISFRMCNARS